MGASRTARPSPTSEHPRRGRRNNRQPSYAGIADGPSFNADRGFHEAPFILLLHCDTPGADIHYTLDGSPPDRSSARYEDVLPILENTVIRAQAYVEKLHRFARQHPYLRRRCQRNRESPPGHFHCGRRRRGPIRTQRHHGDCRRTICGRHLPQSGNPWPPETTTTPWNVESAMNGPSPSNTSTPSAA